jgi:hypothetical protein
MPAKRLRTHLTGHFVQTAGQVGWAGLRNGALLRRMEGAYDAFITIDRNLSSQQNLENISFGIIVLRAPSNRPVDLLPLAPQILRELETLQPGQLVVVS